MRRGYEKFIILLNKSSADTKVNCRPSALTEWKQFFWEKIASLSKSYQFKKIIISIVFFLFQNASVNYYKEFDLQTEFFLSTTLCFSYSLNDWANI